MGPIIAPKIQLISAHNPFDFIFTFSLMLHICFHHADCPFLQLVITGWVSWKYLCFTNSIHSDMLVQRFHHFLMKKAVHTSSILLILIPSSSKGRQIFPRNPMMFTTFFFTRLENSSKISFNIIQYVVRKLYGNKKMGGEAKRTCLMRTTLPSV